jgi:DNA sulfur modification protein DndD
MVFEEFVLNNFGIYKGRHVVKLNPPSFQKAIILFGGLNGSGKTTLLEALQLTLYGKFAKSSNRGNMNYFDYLRRMINHHIDPKTGASLELQFKHFHQGKQEFIRIQRSWHLTGKCVKETVEVQRDGVLDAVITEHWYEYVEEFIPSRISNLFFFDGEKIEALADTNKSAELLKTGINALLGLDLVERLNTDLLTLERKRKNQLQSETNRTHIETIEEQIEQLETRIQELTQQKYKVKQELNKIQQEQKELWEEYQREGGELFEQRLSIEAQLTETREQFAQIEEQLREIATGETPLMLVQDLLRETETQAIQEEKAKHNQIFQKELAERDAALLKLLKKHTLKRAALTEIETFIQQDQNNRQQLLEIDAYLQLEPLVFAPLQDNTFKQIRSQITRSLTQAEEIKDKITTCERKLDSIPDPESLTGIQTRLNDIQKEIQQAEARLNVLEQEQKHIAYQLKRQNAELVQAYETDAAEQFNQEVKQRSIQQSEKVRNTLSKFGALITQKHIQRLEFLILESFHQLNRKDDFIKSIEIEPNTYTLSLYTPNQDILFPESLSAGERQLLAISILWGLSRAAGRPLPAIIDTPLSRLDGEHRNKLVENYFDQASHQVILLSTDEEINQKYYHSLKTSIGREYHIHYDKERQSSVIDVGYFF